MTFDGAESIHKFKRYHTFVSLCHNGLNMRPMTITKESDPQVKSATAAILLSKAGLMMLNLCQFG